MSRLKILHIISNLMSGGAEAMLNKVVRASPDVDHVVVSMLPGGPIAEELRSAGVPVHSLSTTRSFGAAWHLRALRGLVTKVQPNVIQGWMYHGNFAGTAVAIGMGRPIPVIWNIRQSVGSLANETTLTKILILAGAPLSRMPQAIIYNARRSVEDHERLGYARNRRIVIPNGFDIEVFKPDSAARSLLLRELGLPETALLIGRVASFHAHKDFPTLFDAFDAIARKNPDAHLVLVGRGLDRDNSAFAALMAALPFTERVHVMGERNDIAPIVSGFDVMMSSSSSEAFPNVIGEAMACGVPTITTDAGDCAMILDDPERTVAVRDSAALAEKTLALLAMAPTERSAIGAKDRAQIQARYSIAAVTAEYVSLWRRLAC